MAVMDGSGFAKQGIDQADAVLLCCALHGCTMPSATKMHYGY